MTSDFHKETNIKGSLTNSLIKTLGQLTCGEQAVIHDMPAEHPQLMRLYELGFCEGVTIKKVRIAPLGDPCAYLIHGGHISLRNSEANLIKVLQPG